MTWIIIPKDSRDSTETWDVPINCIAEIFRDQQWNVVDNDNEKSLIDNSANCEIIVLKRRTIGESFKFLDRLSDPQVFVHLGGDISGKYGKIKEVSRDWEKLTEKLELGADAKKWRVFPISEGSGYPWKRKIKYFRDNRKKEDKKESLYQYLEDAWQIARNFYNIEMPEKQLAEVAFPVSMDLQVHLDQDQDYSKADLKASFDSVAEDFKKIKEQFAHACELLCRYESIHDRLNDENFEDLNVLKDDIDGFIEAFKLFSKRYTQIVFQLGSDDQDQEA